MWVHNWDVPLLTQGPISIKSRVAKVGGDRGAKAPSDFAGVEREQKRKVKYMIDQIYYCLTPPPISGPSAASDNLF